MEITMKKPCLIKGKKFLQILGIMDNDFQAMKIKEFFLKNLK
jgi:hypothetical protein